jgi:glycosyltransferase involved in cell wall biosynthesis
MQSSVAESERCFDGGNVDILKIDPETDFPRVLVLSDEVPQTVSAGAILLYRLFRGYGKQAKLADQETKRPRDEETKLGSGGQAEPVHFEKENFDISKNEGEAKLFVIGPKAHAGAELLDCPYRELRMPLRRLETSRFNVHKRSLQALGIIPLPSHRKILRMLGDFRPEVIVTVMQGTPFICLAERTARKLGVPLVLIVHDLNEEFEQVFPWAKQALFETNRRVYRSAARRLCVSPEMAKHLEQRYGVPGEVMYPNRSEELQPRAAELSLTLRAAADQRTKGLRDEKEKGSEWHEAQGERQEEDEALRGQGDGPSGSENLRVGEEQATGGSEHTPSGLRHTGRALTKNSLPATSNSPQASTPLTLGYAGSLAYGYGEALVDLIPVLREVGARILISTPRPPEKLKALLEATDVVEWMPHWADIIEMWRTMQGRADVMILPYSNPAESSELLYRTHFPSKLTEYLALGMPVVVSGPEFATGVRWALGERREARGEMREASNFERDHFDILKRAPNGAVPCTTRGELVACLKRFREDGALRSELAERAVLAGAEDFDPWRTREVFWQTLQDAFV